MIRQIMIIYKSDYAYMNMFSFDDLTLINRKQNVNSDFYIS